MLASVAPATLRRRLASLDMAVVRWWVVSLLFFGFDFPLLYVLVDVAHLATPVANLITAECSTLLRYFVTDRMVFGQRRPSWRRLAQFHASTGGAFVVWWIVATALASFGLHYLIAAALGSACSVGVNLVAHFRWIWRARAAGSG